jgi:hypothetical protein
MTRKLMLRTWAGPLPEWTPQFREHVEGIECYGWKFRILNFATPAELSVFQSKVRHGLGVRVNPQPGTRKICEFDPALALIFPELVKDYDFWGHFNLDCVYGRLDRFLPESFLESLDLYADDPHQVCGPFTLYRNTPFVNNLFQQHPRWANIFAHDDFAGFDEGEFSDIVRQAHAAGKIRFRSGSNHSHDKIEGHREKPRLSISPDGRVIEFGVTETMFFHFNESRKWPIAA